MKEFIKEFLPRKILIFFNNIRFTFLFKTKQEILTIEREGIGYLKTFLYER